MSRDPLLQAVKVWDARQRTPVMHLPDWHRNAINTIKYVCRRISSECCVIFLCRYHPTQPDLIMTCGFDQTVKVMCRRSRGVFAPASTVAERHAFEHHFFFSRNWLQLTDLRYTRISGGDQGAEMGELRAFRFDCYAHHRFCKGAHACHVQVEGRPSSVNQSPALVAERQVKFCQPSPVFCL